MNEFTWKDVVNALSLANMSLGLFSIFCSFCKYVWAEKDDIPHLVTF